MFDAPRTAQPDRYSCRWSSSRMATNLIGIPAAQTDSSAWWSPFVSMSPGGRAAHTRKQTPTSAKLSILVPVYNERYTVDALLQRVTAAALPPGVAREIIVVDDASTDGTRAVLEETCQRYPDLIRL